MFHDRSDAGRQLARRLEHLRGDDVVVVGLPRGGIPVAAEVATALDAPLDVVLVRKLGVPYQPELAMGAIGEEGVRVLNPDVVQMARVTDDEIAAVEDRERTELERRVDLYRAGRSPTPLADRIVVVIDDGIATGSTAKAACRIVRAHRARKVILAVPVAPADWQQRMAGSADEFVALDAPRYFSGVGQFYADFSQTSDREVIELLDAAAAHRSTAPSSAEGLRAGDTDVELQTSTVRLDGHLTVPESASGIVIFVHGSGSSRHSPRNRFVASVLNEAGLATLLFDLLTPSEERDRANVFDITLLADRLRDVTELVAEQHDLAPLPIGYFGASTGAAAALRAAARPGPTISAVVSRGGRPDLADHDLAAVRAPTLLIVGGHDHVVLDLNRDALGRLTCTRQLEIVPGATHLFEEPGTLQAAADLACDWFLEYLQGSTTPS